MSRTRMGLAAGEVVLGLVIERPDHGFGLERRLEERFGAARFAYSTAYNALYRLRREGYVRVVDGADGDAREAVFEATERGHAHFREWVSAGSGMPAPREELHAKVAFCQPRELPRLIEMLAHEELACVHELDAVRKRILAAQDEQAGVSVSERDWPELTRIGAAHGEASWWSGRIEQLSKLRAYLEQLRAEAQRRVLQEDRQELARRRQAG